MNNIILTTATGDILVNGTNGVTGSNSLTLTSTNSGNIDLGKVSGGVTGLNVSTGGTVYLTNSSITTATGGTGINMSGAGTVKLDTNVTMTSNNKSIDLGSTGSTSITSGSKTLTLNAGAGALTLDKVDISTLTIGSAGSNALYGNIIVDNAVNFANAGNTTLEGDVTVTTSNDNVIFAAIDGGYDLKINAGNGLTLGAVGQGTPVSSLTTNSGMIGLNGNIKAAATATATGNISITTATGDIFVDHDITTSGSGTIALDSGGDLDIGSNNNVEVSTSGDITLTGGDITLGSTSATGKVTTTTAGAGNIKVNATGTVKVIKVGSGFTSVGYLDIDPTAVNNAGTMNANDYVTISASGTVTNTNTGTISTNNANSYISVDAGNIVQNGDITTPTSGTEHVDLTARTGSITDTSNGTTDITTQTLKILRASSVGSSATNGELDTDVGNLYVTNVSGNSYISEQDAIILTGVAVTGDFTLTAAGGDINQNASIVSTGGAITLKATGGAIIMADGTKTNSGAGTIALYRRYECRLKPVNIRHCRYRSGNSNYRCNNRQSCGRNCKHSSRPGDVKRSKRNWCSKRYKYTDPQA